jgi:hypothetical protein
MTRMRRFSEGPCLNSASEFVPRLRGTGFDPLRVWLTDAPQDRFVPGLDLFGMGVGVFESRSHLFLAEVELFGDLVRRVSFGFNRSGWA